MSILSGLVAEEVAQVFMDVQTELVFFALAVGTHFLFFSKLSFKPGAAKQKVVEPASPSNKQQRGALVAFKAALRSSDIKTALIHFEELQSLWQQHDSPSSAPHALMEQLVKLAAQKGSLEELLETVAKMGLLAKAFDMILSESTNLKDGDTLKQVEELGRARSVKFTAATYQALLKGAGMFGTLGEARKVMTEATEAGMADAATYNAYVKTLVKKGSLQEVRKVLQTMRTEGIRPSTTSFNGLVGSAVQTNIDAAWSIVGEMKAFDVMPDNVTCSILLKGITPKSKAANLEKVLALLDTLGGDVDEVLLSSVVEASVRVGRADLLVPFLKKHASNGVTVKGACGAHTYGSIIRAYGYVQDMKGAWDAWKEMRRQQITPISVTLGCMVEAVVTNGDIEGGYELIHEMLADQKTAHLVNAVMYGSIIKGFSHNKSFDRVWQVYDEMLDRKLQFSMVTYNTLIDACARSGDLGRIPCLLKDIEAQGLKMGIVTYSAILKGYCQKNRLNEAFELLETMTRTTGLEPDEIMYNTLLDGCARQGLYDRGMALLEKMKQSGVRPSNFTLSVLVKLASRGKKLEKAFELCEELSAKHGFRLNVHVFGNLIQACITYQDLPRAIGLLERMLREGVRPDVRCYSLLLRACVETRRPEEAAGLLRTATGLKDPHPRLAKYAGSMAQPQGGLPGDLVSEILVGIGSCHEERLAAGLFVGLSRVPGLKLDPKLRLRFTARMTEF